MAGSWQDPGNSPADGGNSLKTVLMTMSAATTAYLTPTALIAAQSHGGYLCSRYGVGCPEGVLPVVAEPANAITVLILMAGMAAPALIVEARRKARGRSESEPAHRG